MGSTLHPVDHLRERAHLCPIGKVDRIPAVGWAAGYPHNEADDLPVEEAVTGIVDFSRKHSQFSGSPRQALQEFDHVGIGVGMAFFRFAGDQIDGEKRVRPCSEYRPVALQVLDQLGAMLAVTNTGTHHNLVVRRQVEARTVGQRDHRNAMSLRFQQRLQVSANLQGVAIRRRVDKENIHLRGGVPGKDAGCCHMMNQPAKRFLAPDQTNARARRQCARAAGFSENWREAWFGSSAVPTAASIALNRVRLTPVKADDQKTRKSIQ